VDRKPYAELSLAELLRQLATDATELVRQELQLARVELTDKGKKAGASAGLFGAAAILGLGAFGALTACLIAALALVLPLWAAALIVSVVYGGAAAIVALRGKKSLADVSSPAPGLVLASVQADVDAVRAGVQRGR